MGYFPSTVPNGSPHPPSCCQTNLPSQCADAGLSALLAARRVFPVSPNSSFPSVV